MRKFKAVLATILACLVLAGCSVLPEEDAPEKEPEKEAPTSTVMEVPEREASEEDVRSAYISEFKLRYLFNMHTDLPLPPFAGPMHGANEGANFDKLIEALKIYILALLRLQDLEL